jgi:2'-5' RNA ligase
VTVGRAFVAIVPPDDVLDVVARVVAALDSEVPGARWTRREQWHLTLQFLGNRVDLDATATALRTLEGAASASLQLGRLGAFSTPRRARVVWLGVAEGGGWLGALAADVARTLAPTGFVPEDRPYHPHLTLARFAAPADVRAALEAPAAVPAGPIGPRWTPSELVLFHSVTRREGATHTRHAVIPLGA